MQDATATLKSELVEQIDSYTARQTQPDLDFDRFSAKLATKWLHDQTNVQLRELGRLMIDVATKNFFMLRVFELKLEQVLSGVKFAANHDNPTVLIALTRSAVEHLAAFAFQQYKLANLVEALSGQSSETKVTEALLAAARTVERLYSGQSPKGSSSIKQFNVNDFLEALARRVSAVRSIYDELCEFVHPNFGSNSLVSSGTIAAGKVSIAEPLDQPHKLKAFKTSLIVVKHAVKVSATIRHDLLADLIRLQNWTEISGQPKSTVGNLFSERATSHIGDGKSMATAIAFPKARTNMEAVALIYRFLEENGFERVGNKEVGGIDHNYIYDVFNTNRGKVWFKVKLPTL